MNKSAGIYKTEAIVLSATQMGEQDILLTFYSRGYGRITARAISARKKEGKLKGYLQPFTYGRFLLAKSKTIDIVTDVELLENFNYLRGSLAALAYAYYFSELIGKLVVGSEPDENVWRLVLRVFEVLDQRNSDLVKIKVLFEQKLLEFLGYGKQTKTAPRFIWELFGEEVKAEKFLKMVS